MKHLNLSILFLLNSFAFAQTGPTRDVPYVTSYKPPVFTDANRLKKLEAAFPIVEKLYRDVAEKRHYPGMAFGIVVDGKLVYSGGFGYTDVAKKRPPRPNPCFGLRP